MGHSMNVQYQRGPLQTVAVVVCTCPQAIPLANDNHKKNQLMGFLFFPIWAGGSAWQPFRQPKLRYENMFLNEEVVQNSNLCDAGFLVLWKVIEKLRLELVKLQQNLAMWLNKFESESCKLHQRNCQSTLRYWRVAIKNNIWFDLKALIGASILSKT